MRKYCECKESKDIYVDDDEWGYWDVCNVCKRPIEGTYHYYNHYDGEDHPDEDYD